MNEETMVRWFDNSMDRPKKVSTFRQLMVYQRAFNISLEVHKVSLGFPKIEQYVIADQLRRATKSICANIAEGFTKQKYSITEFGRFLAIAEASANETLVWIEYAAALAYISHEQFLHWDNEYNAIGAMLNKLRSKL